MSAHTHEEVEILRCAKKALGNHNFDGARIQYEQGDERSLATYHILGVTDSAGKEHRLYAHWRDHIKVFDAWREYGDHVMLFDADTNKRIWCD